MLQSIRDRCASANGRYDALAMGGSGRALAAGPFVAMTLGAHSSPVSSRAEFENNWEPSPADPCGASEDGECTRR